LEPQASPYSIDTLRKLAQRIDRKKDVLYFMPEATRWLK